MARKPTEADKLAKELELQLAALNAQPSPVDVVRNITNQPATTTKATTYEEARANVSQIKDPKIRAQFEKSLLA
jgi:formiminotetrahydrofolate cyclodeaminase